MFISFFTGKVMLFYGISLIMKEKSNASALFKAVLFLCLSLGAERSLQCLSDSFYAVVEMDAMRFDGGTVHR